MACARYWPPSWSRRTGWCGTRVRRVPVRIGQPIWLNVVQQLPAMQRYDWVVDNLNTHWSLAVCRLVAQWCHVPYLPQGFACGVQRRAFLSDPTHQHVFHFTPKHGSWLDQVELWFSVLARRFLKRGDFASADDFETRLGDYLEMYNTHHAHPYRWTYTGQPLSGLLLLAKRVASVVKDGRGLVLGRNVSNGPSIHQGLTSAPQDYW